MNVDYENEEHWVLLDAEKDIWKQVMDAEEAKGFSVHEIRYRVAIPAKFWEGVYGTKGK